MNFEGGFINHPESKKEKNLSAELEKLLWEKAEELSHVKQEIKQESEILYGEIQEMNRRNINLHEQNILKQKEDRYWQLEKEMKQVVEDEKKIEIQLDDLNNGKFDEMDMRNMIQSLKTENTECISKRKQKILEERARLGDEAMFIDYGLGGKPQVAHPTTGRNLKSVKMNTDSYNAASEFFYKTADTHGGKVDAGKHGNQYASKSGKMIRKK